MSDCIFCAIAAGNIPSASLWEDERTFAFLDINPLRPGHALVVPKAHATRHAGMDAPDRDAVWATVAKITPALCDAVGAADATIAVNDGPAAGQEVPHVHVHIVPRKPGDGGGPVHALFANRPTVSSDELHDVAIRVQRAVDA